MRREGTTASIEDIMKHMLHLTHGTKLGEIVRSPQECSTSEVGPVDPHRMHWSMQGEMILEVPGAVSNLM